MGGTRIRIGTRTGRRGTKTVGTATVAGGTIAATEIVTGNATGIPARTAASRAITTTETDEESDRAAGIVIVTASGTEIATPAPGAVARGVDVMIMIGVVDGAHAVAATSVDAMIEAVREINETSLRKEAAGNAHM